MKPDWQYPQLVPKQDNRTGPEQAKEMAIPPANLQHMGPIGPRQPDFGINMHLIKPSEPMEMKTLSTAEGPNAAVTGDFAELRQMDTTVIERVIDPLRIQTRDGRIVQLAGIDVPGLNPYEPDENAVAARDLLEGLLKGQQVRLYQTKNAKSGRMNRMGHPLVHIGIAKENGAWAQGTLLAAGLARVRPSQRNPEMAAQMITLEDKARDEGKGMWADPANAGLTADNAVQGVGNLALVQGRVISAAMVGNIMYVNFGPDWRTDFTIGIDNDVRQDLLAAGIDPMKLGGATVRVRGWLRDYNGPYMDLLNPAWLGILTEPDTAPTTGQEKGESQ
jgi:endonuclease YncB( thermonuclease family)